MLKLKRCEEDERKNDSNPNFDAQCSRSDDQLDCQYASSQFLVSSSTSAVFSANPVISRRSLSCPDIKQTVTSMPHSIKRFHAVEIDIMDEKPTSSTEELSTRDVRDADELELATNQQQIGVELESGADSPAEFDCVDGLQKPKLPYRETEPKAEAVALEYSETNLLLNNLLDEPIQPPIFPVDLKQFITSMGYSVSEFRPADLRLRSVVYEFITNEARYAYRVRMVRANLYQRLRNQVRLTSEQIERVFPRNLINTLVCLHCPFANSLLSKYLAQLCSESATVHNLSFKLLEYFHENESIMIDTYGRLMANQEAAQAEYQSWLTDKRSSDKTVALAALCKDKMFEVHSVSELLLLITLRPTKYPALFKVLSKESEQLAAEIGNSNDSTVIEEQVNRWRLLVDLSEGILRKIGSLLPAYESEARLSQLQARFDPRAVALYDLPLVRSPDVSLKQKMRLIPSVIPRNISARPPDSALISLPSNLLQFFGQFGKEDLDISQRKLLLMVDVKCYTRSGKLKDCSIVLLTDFVLLIRDDKANGRACFFALDGRPCCVPINYVTFQENRAEHGANGLLMLLRLPHRSDEVCKILCSSAHDRVRLTEVHLKALLELDLALSADIDGKKVEEHSIRLLSMIDRLDDEDQVIQKAICAKVALFNRIFELVNSQFGPNVVEDLRMSRLETASDLTQQAACIDATSKLNYLLRNLHLLATVGSASTGENGNSIQVHSHSFTTSQLTHPYFSRLFAKYPSVNVKKLIDSQDLHIVTRALQSLCDVLPDVIDASIQFSQLEAMFSKRLEATTQNNMFYLGDAAVEERSGQLDSNVSIYRNASQTCLSKQFSELQRIEQALQVAKREWDQQRSNEQVRLNSIDEELKRERIEIEKQREEIAKQFELLRTERKVIQDELDRICGLDCVDHKHVEQLSQALFTRPSSRSPRSSIGESPIAKILSLPRELGLDRRRRSPHRHSQTSPSVSPSRHRSRDRSRQSESLAAMGGNGTFSLDLPGLETNGGSIRSRSRSWGNLFTTGLLALAKNSSSKRDSHKGSSTAVTAAADSTSDGEIVVSLSVPSFAQSQMQAQPELQASRNPVDGELFNEVFV